MLCGVGEEKCHIYHPLTRMNRKNGMLWPSKITKNIVEWTHVLKFPSLLCIITYNREQYDNLLRMRKNKGLVSFLGKEFAIWATEGVEIESPPSFYLVSCSVPLLLCPGVHWPDSEKTREKQGERTIPSILSLQQPHIWPNENHCPCGSRQYPDQKDDIPTTKNCLGYIRTF